ncbi:MAG: hypothetical protein GXY44_14450 [Phycisphaerales bacterium]|nr:hypothetical protein [Phycisphaerales bacterium]
MKNRNLHAMLPVIALVLLAIYGGGCTGTWRPPTVQPETPATQSSPTLAECLRSDRLGRRVYERRDLTGRKDATPSAYARCYRHDRIQEGILAERSFLPLDRYLVSTSAQPSEAARPRLSFGRLMTIYFEVTDPLATMPLELESNQPIRSSTSIRYFDYLGRPSMLGTVTREAEIEGYEDVESPAGSFANCLRVRVDLKVTFPWTMVADLKHFVWLSPQVGEVRRVQNMTGWFLIFWFGSTQEYRLTEYTKPPVADPVDPAQADLAPKWKRGLVVFDRGYPSVRIGGMVIDLAPPADGP